MPEDWSNLANFTIFKCECGREYFEQKGKIKKSWSLTPAAKKTLPRFPRKKNISLITFYPNGHSPFLKCQAHKCGFVKQHLALQMHHQEHKINNNDY